MNTIIKQWGLKLARLGALILPYGTTAERQSNPLEGSIRISTDQRAIEAVIDGRWVSMNGLPLAAATVAAAGTAAAGWLHPVNSSAGSFIIALDDAAPDYARVSFFDLGSSWADFPVSLSSTLNINGLNENLELKTRNGGISLIKMPGVGWVQYGASGAGGTGGSINATVTADTVLDVGIGALVPTENVAVTGMVTITLPEKPDGGSTTVTGDTDENASVHNIRIIPHPSTDHTVEYDTEYFIDMDGARLTWSFDEVAKNWHITSGFRESEVGQEIFKNYEFQPGTGADTFYVDHIVDMVDLYINGTLMPTEEYLSNGTTIVLTGGGILSDETIVQIKAWQSVSTIKDAGYTRKIWEGTVNIGETRLSAVGLENDNAKMYRLTIGGVLQRPERDYTVSSATNEVVLTSPAITTAEWFLLSEGDLKIIELEAGSVSADNTGSTLTGLTVKENINELDGKIEAVPKALVNENKIINGDFSYWQRGETGLTLGDYGPDRFITLGAGGYVQKMDTASLLPPSKRPCAQLGDSTSGTIGIEQRIESNSFTKNIFTFSGKVYVDGTLGSDVDLSQFYLKVATADAKDNFSSVTDVVVQNVALGSYGTWIDFKVTATASHEAIQRGVSVSAYFTGVATNSHFVLFADIKVEEGDKVTAFTPVEHSVNARQCQRFFIRYPRMRAQAWYSGTSNYSHRDVSEAFLMRSVPSASFGSTIDIDPGSVILAFTSGDAYFSGTSINTAGFGLNDFRLDAEL